MLHAERSQRDYATKSSFAQTMTAREFATGEAGLDEETAAKVVKEAAQGKEKSDFVDADTYADIVKFKNFENQRDYAKAYGEQIEAAKQSLESAREQSAVRYADTQRAINEYQKQGMSASATRELINAKFKPGADEINYTRAYNGGADVDPRLAGQGIFYALEKDIAAQAYTPEIYAARLKQRGFSDESAQAFTQAYIQKDINIAKDWTNGKAAEAYEEQIRKNLTREFESNAKNRVNINKDEAYRQHPMIRPDEPSIEQGGLKRDKLTVAREKLASEINVDKLNDEQKDIYDVFIGNKDKVTLQGKDLNDLYMLERGSRNAGVKKIMIKHAGIEKTGGLTNEELLGIMDVVRGGRIAEDSFEQFSDRIRYAYDLKENGVKFRVVIDEYNDGKKVFDYYSDRNFVDYQQDRRGLARTFDPHSRVQVPSATGEIISQKGNLVNEKEANGLRDSVSSVGDNASRAGGRQAGYEQILRQGRRDTTNASQTKRPAQSDEQMEQQWAAKADGQTNAAAATKQVVEKQGSGANIGGGLAANSNAHLGSGLVAGSLNSIDEDGNFSPERFAAGFLAGLAGSKAAAVALRKAAPKLYENLTNTAKSFSDKGIKKIRSEIEKINGITPIKEFGENYAEFYHNGKGAVQKLLAEEQGQVAGAFYRDDLGDITLPWGEAGTGRSDGWGLAKIKRFHPEVMDRLDEIIRDGKFYFDEKGRPNIKLGDEIVGLKDNWLGKETPYWIVSSYDKSLKARPSEGINSARSKKAIGENFSSETGHEAIIPQNLDDAASNLPKPEDIIAKHPNVERELDESIAAMRIESFNDSNFKDGLISKFDTKEITTQELGKSVNLSDKQLAVLKNDIKNADFKVINESKIYFDKIGKDGDKKRFFVDIAEDGSLRVDAYAKSQIDNIPVKQSALEELAGTGDAARLKNMSFEVKAAYRNELDPIKKEAILKTAELNKLKKAAQSGDKAAAAKFEEFKAKNLDENGDIKDGLSLC